MLYACLIYLIVVAFSAITLSNAKTEQEIVEILEEDNPDYFSIVDARLAFRKLIVVIILLSPLLILVSTISRIYGAITGDTRNAR